MTYRMEIKRALYIITEGRTDAQILHTLLDCSRFGDVYHIPSNGYNNIASMVRTIRLLKKPSESNDKILVVFDADSMKEEVRVDRIATMQYLTNAEFDSRIGIFCFVPTLDQYLFNKYYKLVKGDRGEFIKYLQSNLERLRELLEIRKIQEFLDKE